MNENELLEYQKMLDMINCYNKKSAPNDEETASFLRKPAAEGEGPLPLPTPGLPSENDPASPSEGPLPLPTPSLPSRPQMPGIPIITVKPSLPPWSDIRPAGNCMGACLPFAYPDIEVRNIDEGTACIIYDLFAGRVSVLSAFMACTYDGAYFYDERGNVGKLFRDVALCDENHLNMLALLITKLGGQPKYHGCIRGRYTWWQSETDINYPTYLKMALLDMIEMETKLIENFNSAAGEVRDPYVSTLLRRLVMDHRRHLELFTESYNNCCR